MSAVGLIGKKIGMTAIFGQNGQRIPCTAVLAGPCQVVQKKEHATDGYEAVQLGFESIPGRKLTKPVKGHYSRHVDAYYRYLKEFRLSNAQSYEEGQQLEADQFGIGDKIKITGLSKGRGFSGVMKRWNFTGAPDTHGTHKVHRHGGSIGQMSDPARVYKGKKMPGRMGNRKVTLKNLEIVDVRPEDNVILIKGQVPGPKNGILYLRKD